MRAAKGRSTKGSLSPLGEARYLLRRGEAGVGETLTKCFGEALTAKFLDASTRAILTDVKSAVRKLSSKGKPYAPPNTAVAGFAPSPVREPESAPVRHMAILLLTVLERLEPDGSRVASRALWLGNPNAIHQPPNSLAGRVGRTVRELERYLAVFRTAGILEAWQPPSSSGSLKSKRGHCYNVYSLAVPMPRELTATLAEWRNAHKRKVAADARERAKAPEPRGAALPPSTTTDGQALTQKLLSRFLPPS
jgi:hypothetical protein